MHGKSVGFASQNSRFRNAKAKLSFFFRIIFTIQMLFSASALNKKRKIQCPINEVIMVYEQEAKRLEKRALTSITVYWKYNRLYHINILIGSN
ncbi:hypothetical protein CTM50_01215 [Prevotella intermedia]|uniref:Uncharacterized protein n=1 Tax=Prevotella intermedia TaxID=28131 RepID=A0A2D3N8Q3_PREIN|nr:hypothetical protein CTM50_01215 [Prevotella intermedia]